MEIWKTMRKFKEYKINLNGEIISKNGIILKPYADQDGYLGYRIVDENNVARRVKIHRALYDTFVEPIEENNIIDHINRNRQDNRLENLRNVSKSTNCLNRENRIILYAINLFTENIDIFDNARLFCEKEGINRVIDRSTHLYNNFQIGKYKDNLLLFSNKINFIEKLDLDLKSFIENQNIKEDMSNVKIKAICPKLATNILTNEKYIYRNNTDFAKEFNLMPRSINLVLSKQNKTHKSFKFEYLYFFYKCSSEIIKLSSSTTIP